MKEKSPAFQFYPKDFLSDPDVVVMSYAERGVYITILCYMWLNDGLPDDDDYIGKLLGKPKGWRKMIQTVKGKCILKSGRVYHKRLLKEREKQEKFKNALREAGKKGAEIRWGGHSQATNRPMAKNASSSPSPSPSSNKERGEGKERTNSNKKLKESPTPPFSQLEELQEKFPTLDVEKSFRKFSQHRQDRKLPISENAFILWLENDIENGWNKKPKEGNGKVDVQCLNGCTRKKMTLDEKIKGESCPICGEQLLELWEVAQELAHLKKSHASNDDPGVSANNPEQFTTNNEIL